MLCASLSASAYDFEVDSIYYNAVSLDDLTCKITWGDVKYKGDFVIPSEVTYKGRTFSVIEISISCFENCRSLTSVSIPNSVTKIGSHAFRDCLSLTSVSIPNSVTEIGSYAFADCFSLASVSIPNTVTCLYEYTFYGCRSLKEITIPGSINFIQYCYVIDDIDEYNPLGVFYGCKKLTDISFIYGEETLNLNLFRLPYIKNLYVDRNINWGINSLFISLEKIVLGENIKHFQEPNVLADCMLLDTIQSYALDPPTIDSNFSQKQYMNMTVLVPNEALEAYKHADVWKNFWCMVGFDPSSGVVNITTPIKQKEVIGRYNLNGQLVSDDYEGFTIVRYSDGSTKKIMNHTD